MEDKKIIVLGESHHGKHVDDILQAIEDNPKVKGIFIELPVDYQKSVDEYLENGKVNNVLNNFFKNASREGNEVRNMLKIFDKANNKNISIICIDSSKTRTNKYNEKSSYGYYFLRGESRDDDMFLNIKEYYEENPANYIVIVGAGHFLTDTDERTGDESLGKKMKDYFSNKLDVVYF